MAKCVFCGEKAAFGKTLMKSVFEFKTCVSCHDTYEKADDVVAVVDAYNAGIYEQPQALVEWMDYELEKLQKEEQSYKEWREGRATNTCPMCGGRVLRMDPVSFITSGASLPTLNLSHLNTGSSTYEPYTCEYCGYTEFYSVDSMNRAKARKKRLERIGILTPKTEE